MSSESAGTILVVEDDEEVLERYATVLRASHDVRTAATGDEAMAELDGKRRFDAVLLSSGLDGYGTEAVLREVRYRDLDCRLVLVDDDLSVDRPWTGLDGRLTRPLDDDALEAVGAAIDALDRIPRLSARCRRASRTAADDVAAVDGDTSDTDPVAAVRAELERLYGVVADAGLKPDRDPSTGPIVTDDPEASSRVDDGLPSGHGWEAS